MRERGTCGQARRLRASVGLASGRASRPGIDYRPRRPRRAPHHGTTNPDARFHYIRYDRCYLHPVMFFDSLLRLVVDISHIQMPTLRDRLAFYFVISFILYDVVAVS